MVRIAFAVLVAAMFGIRGARAEDRRTPPPPPIRMPSALDDLRRSIEDSKRLMAQLEERRRERQELVDRQAMVDRLSVTEPERCRMREQIQKDHKERYPENPTLRLLRQLKSPD